MEKEFISIAVSSEKADEIIAFYLDYQKLETIILNKLKIHLQIIK